MEERLMDLYPWIVIGHVFFVIVAFGAHGTSAFAMFQARRETDRARLAAVLDLSGTSLATAGVGLIVALLLGIGAAVMGGHFGRLWPWAAIGVVILTFGVMTPVGANPMTDLRKALGLPGRGDKPGAPPRQPGTDEEVQAAQARLRPTLLSIVGIGALAILVWLMEAKPF
jgi:hypothetical protein